MTYFAPAAAMQGPQGFQGPQGAQGAQGPQGEPGTTGIVTGTFTNNGGTTQINYDPAVVGEYPTIYVTYINEELDGQANVIEFEVQNMSSLDYFLFELKLAPVEPGPYKFSYVIIPGPDTF